MNHRNETFVDRFDRWLDSLSPSSLRFLSLVLMAGAFIFFFNGCFDMGIVGLVLFVCMLKLASYVKKKSKAVPAQPKDYIDVEVQEHKPDIPKINKHPDIHPAYTNTLAQLEACSSQLERQFTQLDAFLDDFFADSTISKSKYMHQVDLARKSASMNLEKARNAINLFGDDKEPTPRRMEVLQQYVDDSRKTVRDVDAIIDELLRVDQSNTELSYDFLDENLESLKQATKYYSKETADA